jgi:hypothetical protein
MLGDCKIRNETETKRNEASRNETTRNETEEKQNETNKKLSINKK